MCVDVLCVCVCVKIVLGMSRASDNTKGTQRRNKYGESTQFSLMYFQVLQGEQGLVSHAPDSLRESLVLYSRAVCSGLESPRSQIH